jgi:hypothetical protein
LKPRNLGSIANQPAGDDWEASVLAALVVLTNGVARVITLTILAAILFVLRQWGLADLPTAWVPKQPSRKSGDRSTFLRIHLLGP